jgi:hypothetical protein
MIRTVTEPDATQKELKGSGREREKNRGWGTDATQKELKASMLFTMVKASSYPDMPQKNWRMTFDSE